MHKVKISTKMWNQCISRVLQVDRFTKDHLLIGETHTFLTTCPPGAPYNHHCQRIAKASRGGKRIAKSTNRLEQLTLRTFVSRSVQSTSVEDEEKNWKARFIWVLSSRFSRETGSPRLTVTWLGKQAQVASGGGNSHLEHFFFLVFLTKSSSLKSEGLKLEISVHISSVLNVLKGAPLFCRETGSPLQYW